jgi:hypothetical protein
MALALRAGRAYSSAIATTNASEEGNTMYVAAPQPLLSSTLRSATAAAVLAAVSLAWVTSEYASREAVQSATASFSQPQGFALPMVEIVGKRDATPTKG